MPPTLDTMADLTLEQRNAALTTWLNDLTTVYEKAAAERDAQIKSASYLAGKLAEVDRERLRLEAVIQDLLTGAEQRSQSHADVIAKCQSALAEAHDA